jgi:hypothetical protein
LLALLAAALFTFLRRLGYSPKISLFVVAIYSLCTINIVYARSGFAEPTVALLVTLAALALFSYSRQGRLSSLITAGICIGYAVFIKKNSLILLPAFLYYLLALTHEGTKKHIPFFVRALYFLLPIAFFVIVIAFQNKILYGGISKTEFGSVKDMLGHVTRKSFPIKGLYYYLISAGKGYLIYNIALVLGIFTIREFFKKYKQLCLFLIFLLLSNLLFYSFIFTRGSIFSWGPRYLFPTMPFMALFLAEFINKAKTMARKISVLFFAFLGFIIQLPALIISFSNYIFFVKEKLALPEYFMDFIPDLSPIKGAWMLLISFIKCRITGGSSLFLYNPDFKFISPLSVPLKGYDAVDIWWINMIKVNHSTAPYAFAGVIIILSLFLVSCMRLGKFIKSQDHAKV